MPPGGCSSALRSPSGRWWRAVVPPQRPGRPPASRRGSPPRCPNPDRPLKALRPAVRRLARLPGTCARHGTPPRRRTRPRPRSPTRTRSGCPGARRSIRRPRRARRPTGATPMPGAGGRSAPCTPAAAEHLRPPPARSCASATAAARPRTAHRGWYARTSDTLADPLRWCARRRATSRCRTTWASTTMITAGWFLGRRATIAAGHLGCGRHALLESERPPLWRSWLAARSFTLRRASTPRPPPAPLATYREAPAECPRHPFARGSDGRS